MRVIEVVRRGRRGRDAVSGIVGVELQSVDRTLGNDDRGLFLRCTAAVTLTLPAELLNGWSLFVDASGGAVTLLTDGTINGSGSLVVGQGNAVMIYSTGTAHHALFFVDGSETILNGTQVGFTPIPGNAATDVSGAIGVLTGLWNAVTSYGKSLIAASNAGAARGVLGLGSASTRDVSANADFTVNPGQLATRATINKRIAAIPVQGWRAPAKQSFVGASVLNFTGIPADVGEIELQVFNTSLSGFDHYLVQLMTASGVVTAGYNGTALLEGSAQVFSTGNGWNIFAGNPSRTANAVMRLVPFPVAAWQQSHIGREGLSQFMVSGHGFVTNVSEPVTGIRFTRTGSDTGGSGSVRIRWRR